MSRGPRVVIIGAGIVGCALADELTARGWTDVTVARPGPPVRDRRLHLPRPGPGLPDQRLQDDDRVRPLHGREVQLARARRAVVLPAGRRSRDRRSPPSGSLELHRRHGLAQSWGIEGRLLDPDECVREPGRCSTATAVLGGYLVPTDGLAKARPRRRGAGAARDRGRRPVPRRADRDRHPDRGRPGHRRRHRPRRVPRRHRGLRAPASGGRSSAHWSGSRSRSSRSPTSTSRPRPCPSSPRSRRRRPRGPAADPAASRTATCTTASTSTASASARTATARCRSTRRRSSPRPTRR